MTDRRSTGELGYGPHELLAAIVESTDDAIIGKTLDGEITSWNQGAERLYGYSADEAIGRHISLIVPADRLPELDSIMDRLRRGERIDHHETKRLCKDRTILDVSVTISPIVDETGRALGASSIARDIGDRLAAQIVERRAFELEAANRAMEDFVAMAAHDLRTPITVIQGFATTMTDAWADLNDDQKLHYLTIMKRQAGQLSSLVSDLLMASRLESHTLVPEPVVTMLDQLVDEVLEELGEAGHPIEVDIQRPTSVFVDTEHLRRILHNLISNALRYGEPPFRLAATSSETAVEISISDEGPGVPREFVPHLFDKFSRSDELVSRQKGGTGLGLAIVRGLVEVNEGRVWYEPNRPRGSVFRLRLPLPL